MNALSCKLVLVVSLLPTIGLRASGDAHHLPGLADDAPCLMEQWPTARTLVWATPGQGGTALEPGNWTEYSSASDFLDGKPGQAATAPPDEITDLILPDAPDGGSYIVGYMVSAQQRRKSDESGTLVLSCRHVTIGAGAALDGGIGVSRGKAVSSNWPWDDTPMGISGNVTVKDGGCIYGPLQLVGDKHTWFSIGKSPAPLGRSLLIRKAREAGVTVAAPQFDLVDGVTVESGRLVLARGTTLRINATDQARIDMKKLRNRGWGRIEPCVWIRADTALEMQAGSRVGRVKPPDEIAADLRLEGLLQIGRDGGDNDDPAVIELTLAGGDGTFLNQPGGLYIRPTAEVRNHGNLAITAANPDPAEAGQGVSIFLEKPVDLGKVHIDHLRAGGIAATDPAAARKSLAAATFGEHGAASGDALYAKIEFIGFEGGPGTVEFVDGLSTECEILYPLGDRLVVRSKGKRITQSLDLRSVHAIEIGGKRTQFEPKRELTAREKELRELNALWADVPGKGQIGNYAKQDWPVRPLMVWRRPGVSGSRFVAANWLDGNGRPCFEVPAGVDEEPDAPDADILLPASDVYYQAVGDRPPWRIRHLTIENMARFHLTYNIGGNLWMKDGSGMQAPWFGRYCNDTPGMHRFLRFDGLRISPGRGQDLQRGEDITLSQWGRYETGPDGTLEIIGTHLVNDHFFVAGEGRMIMSEGSYLAPLGARAAFWIQPEATVVLLQDARIGVESKATDHACIPVLVSGTLMIGTPRRPITRDMLFPVAGMEEDEISREPGENMRGSGVSLLVGKQGRLVLHTADPDKARLVFKMHDSEKAREHGKRWGDPKGIVLAFFGKAELDGVVFDNVLEEGLMVSPAQRASWKNVSFGEHNLAAPERLFWDIEPEQSP